MLDALGNEIIIGNVYGYSAPDTVFIGRVTKFTAKKVTLSTISRKFYRYGEERARTYAPTADSTSVVPYYLFPITA